LVPNLSAYLNVGDCDFVVVFVLLCKAVGGTGFTLIVIAKRVGEVILLLLLHSIPYLYCCYDFVGNMSF
jgi:hypothetical protein